MRAIGFMAVLVAGWGVLAGTEWLATEGVERVWNSLPPTCDAAAWLMEAGLMVGGMCK